MREESENRIVEDVYDVERRLELVSKRIRESKEITERDRQLIFKFADNCILRGLSKLRAVFYLNRFWNIARLVDKDFDRMGRKDIEELVRKIQTKGFAPRTASDHLTAIKTFWKWLEDTGDTYPEKVGWIKPWRKSGTCKLPEELLSKEDVEKLVNASVNPRDKALISILYESGCRIGEILNLRIRNVEFDANGAVLIVKGKTGQHRVRLIHSVPRLVTWVEHHPENGDHDAFLWVSVGSKNNSERLMHQSVATMLKKMESVMLTRNEPYQTTRCFVFIRILRFSFEPVIRGSLSLYTNHKRIAGGRESSLRYGNFGFGYTHRISS